MIVRHADRRRFLGAMAALAFGGLAPASSRAAASLPIADSHSHIGLFSNKTLVRSLKAQMEEAGVSLMAWAIAADSRWIRRGSTGIQQQSAPGPGDQSFYFLQRLSAMRDYLAKDGLAFVQTADDVEAARAGTPHVVITAEGAGFTEDKLELLDQAYAQGLRHVQLVHYIRNGLGDFQTERPEHNGLTELGVKVIQACNRLGILVDLAHCTNADIDRALEVSRVPVIWSHSAITSAQFSWQSGKARLLNIDYAKKIAQRGGAIGLWALQSTVGNAPGGYAGELMRMVDAVGPEHVMFGTDIDGMGNSAAMEQLMDLRKVAQVLQERGVDDGTLKALCFDNYARCLKGAIAGAITGAMLARATT